MTDYSLTFHKYLQGSRDHFNIFFIPILRISAVGNQLGGCTFEKCNQGKIEFLLTKSDSMLFLPVDICYFL